MQTSFCVVTVIVLTLAFALLLGKDQTQLPGQAAGNMANRNYEFPESKGLSVGAGIPQRDFK